MKPFKLLCIVGYLLFMGLAIDSSIVDALVFYVSEQEGTPVYKSGRVKVRSLDRSDTVSESGGASVAAVQFQSRPVSQMHQAAGAVTAMTMQVAQPTDAKETIAMKHVSADSFEAPAEEDSVKNLSRNTGNCVEKFPQTVSSPVARLSQIARANPDTVRKSAPGLTVVTSSDNPVVSDPAKKRSELVAKLEGLRQRAKTAYASVVQTESKVAPAGNRLDIVSELSGNTDVLAELPTESISTSESASNSDQSGTTDSGARPLSILNVIKSLPLKPWEFDTGLNRYVVRYDDQTTVILTLRPALQRLVEQTFRATSCRLGAAIVQDPTSGAILAMTSFDGHTALSPVNTEFVKNNWALKATFPVASIFKIITAAAAFDKRLASPETRIRLGRKAIIELWRAFAKSHNGSFATIGRMVGQQLMQATTNAFGFNQPFYFDLPVTQSVAQLPTNAAKLGEAAAGLNKTFDVSPIHVSSIISTILNDGRMMKPYLVEAIMHRGKVVFRRKSFQLAQPLTPSSSQQIVRMMKTTTTDGTGKKGFNGYFDCPGLAEKCGGKTGTLTGVSPNLLITWWGGFTQVGARTLGLTVLIGQQGTSHVKAPGVAGRISYSLLNNKPAPTPPIASASRKQSRRKR